MLSPIKPPKSLPPSKQITNLLQLPKNNKMRRKIVVICHRHYYAHVTKRNSLNLFPKGPQLKRINSSKLLRKES